MVLGKLFKLFMLEDHDLLMIWLTLHSLRTVCMMVLEGLDMASIQVLAHGSMCRSASCPSRQHPSSCWQCKVTVAPLVSGFKGALEFKYTQMLKRLLLDSSCSSMLYTSS